LLVENNCQEVSKLKFIRVFFAMLFFKLAHNVLQLQEVGDFL